MVNRMGEIIKLTVTVKPKSTSCQSSRQPTHVMSLYDQEELNMLTNKFAPPEERAAIFEDEDKWGHLLLLRKKDAES